MPIVDGASISRLSSDRGLAGNGQEADKTDRYGHTSRASSFVKRRIVGWGAGERAVGISSGSVRTVF
jgi:hypothetical protein